jgi:hypothetical protein
MRLQQLFPAVACMALAPAIALAAEDKPGGLALQAEMEYGGDSITAVDAITGRTQSISVGEGTVVGAGGYFRPIAGSRFEIRGLMGYKFISNAAASARVQLTRMVRQVTGNYRFGAGWSVGAGVVQHSSTLLQGNDSFHPLQLATSTGTATQFGWRWATLQYTNMRYADRSGNNWDASTIGVGLTWRL